MAAHLAFYETDWRDLYTSITETCNKYLQINESSLIPKNLCLVHDYKPSPFYM